MSSQFNQQRPNSDHTSRPTFRRLTERFFYALTETAVTQTLVQSPTLPAGKQDRGAGEYRPISRGPR
ncbi:hypothetical protein RSSM_06133 [Rhodopirellula sallentina SM41]|uniref:Uncharacterized protein n=1 Tax=Rhodopirellula sallentina SM41 TaxID=1263870 RepID=M5U3I1_9BACT|nr:hypothetical protein RSSM_06133 [Rhodopirellula sallentina SM41]